MKRIIDFDVSVAGLPAQVIRVEYEASYSSFDELKDKKYTETRFVFQEAIDALAKELGHNDYQIQYWQWII